MIVKITPEVLENMNVDFIKPDTIKITGSLIVKGEKRVEKFNEALGFCCVSKKETVRKVPIDIACKLRIHPIYLHSIERKKITEIALNNLDTTFQSYKVSLLAYPKEDEKNLIEREEEESYYTNNGTKIYKIKDYLVKFDDYYFEQAIVEEFKNILKNANVEFYEFLDIYENAIFIDIKRIKEIKQKIPYLIGEWRSIDSYGVRNSVAYKYFLESPELIMTESMQLKIRFQRYYQSEKFNLLGITYSEKHLCELTKEEFSEFKDMQNTLTFLSALYDNAEEVIQELFKNDLMKIEQIMKETQKKINNFS